jgi:hypothetical protein
MFRFRPSVWFTLACGPLLDGPSTALDAPTPERALLIVSDGPRWKEVFNRVDPLPINDLADCRSVPPSELSKKCCGGDPNIERDAPRQIRGRSDVSLSAALAVNAHQ